MLKILQVKLQQYVNQKIPDVQAGFRNGKETRNQIWQHQTDHRKSKKIQEIGIPDHLTCLLRNLYAGQEATVRTGHEQQTDSKLGKEYLKAVYSHLAYLTYMQSTSYEVPAR